MSAQAPAECDFVSHIVGLSPATVQLRADIARVAPFASSILITGPSGTGKELVARQVHAQSPRAQKPFIPVDCASMTGELMASQLFGHVAGAFTGANCDALGCIRAANGGTLFLDEIGEMDYSLQAKLLRVLQEHVVTPVGSHEGVRVDVRVVAATNRDLRSEVGAGRFREDLYYRLHVVRLRTSALSERPGDIPLLADAFLLELAREGLPKCSLSAAATDVLVRFNWPGNVRQLRNVLEQAAIDSPSPVICADLLRSIVSLSYQARDAEGDAAAATDVGGSLASEAVPAFSPKGAPPAGQFAWQSLEAVERERVRRTLEHTFYNRSAAARLLGITRQSLLRKIKHFGLDSARKRSQL